MSNDLPSSNGQPQPSRELPPVTPPNPVFILQLFLVPGLLVALVVAFIWLFFGWMGGGPQTPEQFLAGLRNSNQTVREKTAETLAQVLKRDAKLANDVSFALDMAELLQAEFEKPPVPVTEKKEIRQEADFAAEFLPACLATFNAPIGVPVFQEIVQRSTASDRRSQLWRRDAVWAIALAGERIRKLKTLPLELKEAWHRELESEAGSGSTRTGRQQWADEAARFIGSHLKQESSQFNEFSDPFGLANTLTAAARSNDEMTRKLTVLALAVWDIPGAEKVLVELAGPNDDLTQFEDDNPERGRREIRYNAALALVRKGSGFTPIPLVLETLDQVKQRELHTDSLGGADQTILAALQAIGAEDVDKELDLLARSSAVHKAVKALASSDNPRISLEAKKLLGQSAVFSPKPNRITREDLIAVGLAAGVLVLFALAVFARWRRKTISAELLPEPKQDLTNS